MRMLDPLHAQVGVGEVTEVRYLFVQSHDS